MRLIFFLCISLVWANLQCRWACDDPVCEPICLPKCQEVLCEYQCNQTVTCNREPECEVVCADSNNTMYDESCPLCETQCEEPECDCEILCEEPECGWDCIKSRSCRYPLCELTCERPACEFVASGRMLTLFW